MHQQEFERRVEDIAICTPDEMIAQSIADARWDLKRYEENRQNAERDRDVAEAHITEIRLYVMRLEEIRARIRRLNQQEQEDDANDRTEQSFLP